MMIHFTLYSRNYCHLCDDMLEQLQAYSPEYGFTVKVVDIDQDDELLTLYDELVPVLVGQKEGKNEQRLCNYYLDEAALKAFFHA